MNEQKITPIDRAIHTIENIIRELELQKTALIACKPEKPALTRKEPFVLYDSRSKKPKQRKRRM